VKTKANHILSKGYTGAYLGVYATSNGKTTEDYADFDWVNYKGFEKI
jgi:alpha-N-arabinofuranosidase